MHFLVHRHKAGRAAFGLSCVARFEQLACVFASCGALHYAKILASAGLLPSLTVNIFK